ncbi:tubulin glycylase 3A [Cephus cinctus]|uniref:Tubulin glycylase 3A n=1 Tax=Cephus cinctus TaxID=211228 RepID=A0AAJ7RSQ8_CEPCN|nr:tubulin glycylase 3A [Cephus cinctus]
MFTDMKSMAQSNDQTRLESNLVQESVSQSYADRINPLYSSDVKRDIKQNRKIIFGKSQTTGKRQEDEAKTYSKSRENTHLQKVFEKWNRPVPNIFGNENYHSLYYGSTTYGLKLPKTDRKSPKVAKAVVTNPKTNSANTAKTSKEYYRLLSPNENLSPFSQKRQIISQNNSNLKESSTVAKSDPLSESLNGNNRKKGTCEEQRIQEALQISSRNSSNNLSKKEQHMIIQQQVEKAIKNHKIFLIRGDIPYLEDSLKKRGWVQKYESTKSRNLPYGSVASLDAPSLGTIQNQDGSLNEKAIIFHALKHTSPNFIWDCRNEFVDWNSSIKQDTLLNRFQKSFIYTSKLGMATILQDAHWYYEDNVSSVQCPRNYNVGRERNTFVEDYRRTAAVSLLKWFVDRVKEEAELIGVGANQISAKQIEFAIKRCEDYVAEVGDEYLDRSEIEIPYQEWDSFIDDYTKVVHYGNGLLPLEQDNLASTEGLSIHEMYKQAVQTLKKVEDIDPQYKLNGMRNIWILKPSDLCCGTGIVISHKLTHIIKKIHDSPKDYFVVQKYIERPLLVHDTKFDVRQWYLVTKSYPLNIWIYKEALLRFSSRPFTFSHYHEAVHICNTAVQCKYADQKNSVRSQDWDCEKINDYLKKSGHKGEPWYDEIYPKMCEAIVATTIAAQEHMDKRRCSFELYGADFMIMDDLSVWLIEINTNPRMHPPSTRVTARLYPEVLESLIKVILDYPTNPKADTGNFVLAYQQQVTNFQPYLGANMFILGKGINAKQKSALPQP